ncbi:adenosylcobinamide-GDP ribazoletransferase [Shewanella maritima]|uniref:Adenosylcobinamide-GDP ribazoletransferase n=1 Tax=Shewanella maritima TaxID=2520507 RepID=A0A411PJZ0_9GAMM|nr:adenosylcobinamide-GDP ribazoletransferase [Shewanella maritima]QBF83869.1 adenosylcobinamide-GDP ribazoletransferase [Shewanella maritima]
MEKPSVSASQLNLLLVALSFFTRIPVPKWVDYGDDNLNRASRYFGMVGLLVGALSALVFYLAQLVLPIGVAVMLSMIASVLITGGFHEDGLADTADGFGGGWTLEDKLNIMKDSRLGTYGALALVLTLALKWQLLIELALYSPWVACSALVVAHTLSRVLASSMIFTENYVQDIDVSKVKPLANEQHINDLMILLLTGLAVLFCLPSVAGFSLLVGLYILRQLLCFGFNRQIGGYTGDTLGASQQVAEIVCYMILLAVGFNS